MEPMRLAEARSLALHREIARRLRDDPALLDRARAQAARKVARNERSGHLARRWLEILDQGLGRVLEVCTAPGEEAIELRHATPFAGVVPPEVRWRIWREVRAGRRDAPEAP